MPYAVAVWLALAVQNPGPAAAFPRFVDVASRTGLTLMNVSGSLSKDYILEVSGNGAAFFDYDNDDDVDVLIANGSTLERYAAGGDPVAALYENRNGRFTDVTRKAGLTASGWGMGVCVADYDNDGNSDVYVTAYGPNVMYRNNGDGSFSDVTRTTGTGDPRWSSNCAFADYDRDGDVDLYVANYVVFRENDVPRVGESESCRYMGVDVFCGPVGLPGERDTLYRNNGDGTFSDVSADAGITDPGYYGFGVVWSDLDNDGWPDIYVANDSVPNLLYHNEQDGTFTEAGLLSGSSLSAGGLAQAGMGLAVGDYDGNGYFDLFVTNFIRDTNTLYQNLGDLTFYDATHTAKVGSVSLAYMGWGTGFADLDNDGWLDLFVANGHVSPTLDQVGQSYLQRKEIYRNRGDGSFTEIAKEVGGDLLEGKSARGAALGDYDNDGDIDILGINLNDRPSLYRNDGGNRNHWISLRLEGTLSNRDAIGARIELEAGGRIQATEIRSGGSYLSHHDTRAHFGLGHQATVDAVRIRWPSGDLEEIRGLDADQFVTIREGEGVVETRGAAAGEPRDPIVRDR